MKIAFECPSCLRPYEVAASHAGRQGRCKACGAVMTVPHADGFSEDGYALAEPEPSATPSAPESTFVASGEVPSEGESTFVNRAKSAPDAEARKRKKRKKLIRQAKEEASDLAAILVALWPWLVGVPLALAAVCGVIALLVPNGQMIVATILATSGVVLVLTGYFVGAYGAFHEDFVNGMLYFIPFYAAYFIVTNWDTMWRWFLLMGAGSVLISVAAWVVPERADEPEPGAPEPEQARVIRSGDDVAFFAPMLKEC